MPLTKTSAKLYPSEAYVTVSGKQSKATADQVTSELASVVWLTLIGSLSPSDLDAVGIGARELRNLASDYV